MRALTAAPMKRCSGRVRSDTVPLRSRRSTSFDDPFVVFQSCALRHGMRDDARTVFGEPIEHERPPAIPGFAAGSSRTVNCSQIGGGESCGKPWRTFASTSSRRAADTSRNTSAPNRYAKTSPSPSSGAWTSCVERRPFGNTLAQSRSGTFSANATASNRLSAIAHESARKLSSTSAAPSSRMADAPSNSRSMRGNRR